MDTCDIKNYSKILCEIIMKRDRWLFNEIRELKLSAISNQAASANHLMEIIKAKLVEWEINIESFASVTTKENSLATMNYLIETIQSDYLNDDEQLSCVKEMLRKDIRSVDKLDDCLEIIPELLLKLQSRVLEYNVNIKRRINIYKPLKDFASDLYTILCCMKRKLNNFMNKDVNYLEITLTKYMQSLLESSIVISDYPPRTIKKGTVSKIGTHFKTTMKCLIENEKLFSKEELKLYFLNENDFMDYTKTKELKTDCIVNYVPNFKLNIWELKNMLWSPPDRQTKDRKKSDRITNQKAIILIKFKALANPYLFGQFTVNVCLHSDTVISIVHTNQEIEAMITLFWDDYFRTDKTAFYETGLFTCKDVVDIADFVDAMSQYFEKETCRGLTSANKEYLGSKLKRMTQGPISLMQFGGQNMPDATISFGHWMLSIIKLLKIPGVFELWTNNFIDGFMAKEVDSQFVSHSPGTFSLRFSEKSAKIGVIIKTPSFTLEAWNPFSIEECRNRNLCELLMDFHELQFIRMSNGSIERKEESLASFIQSKHPDVGYTERGQLSRILCSNIYLDNFSDFDNNDDAMDADIMDLELDDGLMLNDLQ